MGIENPATSGSILTVPVNQSSGPFADRCEPTILNPPLVSDEAAVDWKCYTHDKGRRWAAQPKHGGRNLFRLAHATDRLLFQELLHSCRIDAVAHRRLDAAGADGIHADALGGNVHC